MPIVSQRIADAAEDLGAVGLIASIRGWFASRRSDRAKLWARVESLEVEMRAKDDRYDKLYLEHSDLLAKYSTLQARYDELKAEVDKIRARQEKRIVSERKKKK